MHDRVPFEEGLEALAARRGSIAAHEFVRGERAVEILEQLPQRVVVAIAQVAVVEAVGPGPEAAHVELLVAHAHLFDRPSDVGRRHRPRREHPAAGGLAHLLSPAVVRARQRRLDLRIDPVRPHVVARAVQHHHVDALDAHRVGHAGPVEAAAHHVAVLLGHLLRRPADGLLEAAVQNGRVLRIASIDQRGSELVPARDRLLPADSVLEPLVEEPLPDVARLHHVRIRIEDLHPVSHVVLPPQWVCVDRRGAEPLEW